MIKKLRLFSTLLLLAVASVGWAEDIVITLDNIGASIGSTANTAVATTDITATGTTDAYTLNYFQCKKQGNAMLMTKSESPYISNKTAMPGNIKSVEVFINSGASGKTTYDCAFSTTECTIATSGIGAVNITGGNSHVFSNPNVEGKYFCITLGNANNGQVLKLVITCEAGGDTPVDQSVATTTTIDASGITNTDVYTNTAAGKLTATVTADGNSIEGATVTWSSSKENVATIAADGTVTLVAAGTTTITASYAGVENEYKASNANYELTVTSSAPYTQPTIIEANLNNALFGTEYTGTASGITDSDPVSGTIDNVTITYAGSGNHYINDSQIRFYPSNKLTFTAPEGYKITSIVFTSAGTWAATISADEGEYTDNKKTWSGSESTVVFTGSGSSRCDMSKATITLASADAVAVPVISGTESFLESTEVTIAAEEGATIYYTTDGNTPTASSTKYTEPFTLNATTTVKAIAVKDGKSSTVAEKSFAKINPLTVAEALATADNTEVYVRGIVSRVKGYYDSKYITYYISDDGTENNELEAYNGLGLNQSNFTSQNDLQVGEEVVVFGKLTTYQGTKELATNNYLVSHITKEDPAIAYAVTEYTVAPSATFETPELTNPHNLAVTYSISENEGVASIDATTGAVTIGTEEGSVTVTATFAGNNQYRAGSASYIIRVSDPNKGTEANPYTVADVIAGKADGKKEIYVIGYIVGEFNSKTQDPRTSDFTTDANIALADEFTKSPTAAASIPVALPTDDLKTTWGCKTNDGSTIGTKVLVKGNGETYFSVKGIKNTTEVNLVATISAAGYATFANAKAVDFSAAEGLTVLTAQYNKKTDKIDYTEVTSKKVPAGEAVVLKGAQGEYNGTVIASADALENNGLKVNLTENTPATGKEYCLANKNGVVGFYKVATTIYVKAGKAYLEIERTGSTGAKDFYAIDDETDGIRQIENGQLTIENAEIYNLSGQRVNKAQKGIYIVNGKKVVIR